MKRITALLAALVLAGCSLQVKPTPEVEKALEQHSAVLNAIVAYIQQLQEKGVLPAPSPEEQK